MTLTATSQNWIRCRRPNPQARLKLFCLPYAGGGTLIFESWADQLPPEIEVSAIRLPGRETRVREEPFTRLRPLVQTLAEVIRPAQTVPFALFGHSMGALLCFELARWLRSAGQPGPVHLFLSGYRAPQLPDTDSLVHLMTDAELIDELRLRYDAPEDFLQDRELMALYLPLLRADFAACETYVYTNEEPLDCPLTVFGGMDDRKVSREALSAWSVQTSGSFKLRMFPGSHYYLQTARRLLLPSILEDLKATCALRDGNI